MEVVIIITVYLENETNFNHNGEAIIQDETSCVITRAINGEYEAEVEIPLSSSMVNYIKHFSILKIYTPAGFQLFRVKEMDKDLYNLNIYAQHIFFDLSSNFIADTNIVGKTRLEAVQQVLANTMTSNSFIATGDIGGLQNNARLVRKSPIQALLSDDDNSILNRWGLELDFDNFNITVKEKIGTNNGYLIAYRKNMLGIKENLDMKDTVTRVVPEGYNGLFVDEYYIDSPLVNNYYQPLISFMKFDNVKVGPDNYTTEVLAKQALRDIVNKLYSEKQIDKPFFNYEVEFEELGDAEEYKAFKNLQGVNLGDTVTIKHEDLDIDLEGRIIKYTYDSLKKRYNKIEVGTIKKDLTLTIKQVSAQVEFTKESILLEVSNLNGTIDSKIEMVEGQISSKVSSDDLSSLIEQNVDSVKIAFNGISPTLEVNANGLYITDGEFNITSDGRTIFKVQDGYHFNEWGIACRTAQAGGNYYIGGGSKYFNYNDSILFRPFGLYHESLQNPQLPLMLLTNTGRVEIRDLDANYFKGIAAQTGEFNGFIYSNDYISGANIINRSLREIKTNIVKYNDSMAYDGLKGLNVYNFNMENNSLNLGVIVDEAPLEITQLGGGEGADRKGINLYSYISYLAAALKTSINKIEDLENRISTLEGL